MLMPFRKREASAVEASRVEALAVTSEVSRNPIAVEIDEGQCHCTTNPHQTFLFLFLDKALLHTLRHSPKSTGSTQLRSSTSLLPLRKREASAVEPVAGVSEVGRRLRPRWTLFLRLIDYRTQRHRIEPGGGRRVRGGAAKE